MPVWARLSGQFGGFAGIPEGRNVSCLYPALCPPHIERELCYRVGYGYAGEEHTWAEDGPTKGR